MFTSPCRSLRSEPGFRLSEQLLERLAARGRKVRIHTGAVLRLQIGEMAVAFRKARQKLRVERDLRIRIDRVDAVLLVDHRALEKAPDAVALLHPVEEAAAAHRVDFDAVELRAHVDRHAGLRDRAIALDFRRGAAQEMLRARSLAEGSFAGFDERVEAAVEPGRGHRGSRVRGRAQPAPVSGVARERPALHERGNRKLVLQIRHALTRARCPPCEAAPSIWRPRRARTTRSRRTPCAGCGRCPFRGANALRPSAWRDPPRRAGARRWRAACAPAQTGRTRSPSPGRPRRFRRAWEAAAWSERARGSTP